MTKAKYPSYTLITVQKLVLHSHFITMHMPFSLELSRKRHLISVLLSLLKMHILLHIGTLKCCNSLQMKQNSAKMQEKDVHAH